MNEEILFGIQDLIRVTLADFVSVMGWWAMFAIAPIMADLRFGILAARKRGEQIRGSRMRRRTMNKMLDYVTWIFVAYICRHSFGVVLDVPVVSIAIVIYVYANELSSVINNYAEYRGYGKILNLWKLIIGRHDIGKCLEDVSAKKTEEDG